MASIVCFIPISEASYSVINTCGTTLATPGTNPIPRIVVIMNMANESITP